MKLDSVRSRKLEESSIASASRVEALLGTFSPPPVAALGVAAGARPGDYRLAVRVEPGAEALAEEIRARSAGEVDIRVVRVEARPHTIPEPQAGTPSWLNERRRPLEPGVAVSPQGSGWVGTLGCFVRRPSGALAALSNAHVFGAVDRVPAGTGVLQPFGGQAIGVTAEHVPLKTTGNLADAQLADLRAVGIILAYSHAVGDVRGPAAVTPADLGREAFKVGRTTGVRKGICTAVEVDRLGVSYGAAGVLSFDDQVEFTGGAGPAFSAGGDSGSLILWGDGYAPGLLYAGGRGNDGVDVTFANRLSVVLGLLDVALAAA